MYPDREVKLGCPFQVDTVNGERLRSPVIVPLEGIKYEDLPKATRCVFRGYESGRMIGVPEPVLQAENRHGPQAGWQFYRFFVVTSVVEPSSVKVQW
jgi:hypothetical protein